MQTLKLPEYVLWNVDSKPLNFGSDHGWSRQGNGGHSITFDLGPPSVSRLSVHSATAIDSGRYTCQPPSGLPASTNVHVALGIINHEIYRREPRHVLNLVFLLLHADLNI